MKKVLSEKKLHAAAEKYIQESLTKRLHRIMVDLTDVFLHQCRHEVVKKEPGLECDEKVINTHIDYRLQDYPLVGDFLKEASGDCRPDYLQGYGEYPETFENWVLESIETLLYLKLGNYIKNKLHMEPQDMFSAASERVISRLLSTQGHKELKQLQATDMSWMVTSCRDEAEQLAEENWRAQEAAIWQEIEDNQTAQHIQHQAHFLLQRRKYLLKDFEELLGILHTLKELVPEEDFLTYLQSTYFAERVSVAVFSRIQTRFIHYDQSS